MRRPVPQPREKARRPPHRVLPRDIEKVLAASLPRAARGKPLTRRRADAVTRQPSRRFGGWRDARRPRSRRTGRGLRWRIAPRAGERFRARRCALGRRRNVDRTACGDGHGANRGVHTTVRELSNKSVVAAAGDAGVDISARLAELDRRSAEFKLGVEILEHEPSVESREDPKRRAGLAFLVRAVVRKPWSWPFDVCA